MKYKRYNPLAYIRKLKKENIYLIKMNKKLNEINSYLIHELDEQYNVKYQPTFESEYNWLSVDDFVDLSEENK